MYIAFGEVSRHVYLKTNVPKAYLHVKEPILMVSDPQGAAHVLNNNEGKYPRSEGVRAVLSVAVCLSGSTIQLRRQCHTVWGSECFRPQR
jgi:hypothetical protein